MLYEKHIDKHILLLEKKSKKLKEYREHLITSIERFIYLNNKYIDEYEYQLKAALHYGLEIEPEDIEPCFPFKIIGDIGEAKIKENIGNTESGLILPTYVGKIRDIAKKVDLVDMWKFYVENDKTRDSYNEFVKDIVQHRDQALYALIEQYYGERILLVNNERLHLIEFSILIPKSAQIFKR